MAENGIFIAENMYPLMAPTVTGSDAGFPLANAYDNLHYTFHKYTPGPTYCDYTFTPTGVAYVDCAVIDSDFADPIGTISAYDWNGSSYTLKGTITGIVKGANLLLFTSFDPATSGLIRVDSTLQKKTRHCWVGVQLPIKSPLAPFDPEAIEQPQQQFFGRTGMMAKNSPLYTKKVLDMSFQNISGADYTTLLALYNKAYLKSLPFWYFHKPVTQPKNGYLYEFDMEGFQMPFTLGNYRTAQIKAKANWSPDRSTAAL